MKKTINLGQNGRLGADAGHSLVAKSRHIARM